MRNTNKYVFTKCKKCNKEKYRRGDFVRHRWSGLCISCSLIGHKVSKITRERISEKNNGVKRSEETKLKMRGRKVSDVTRRKISELKKGISFSEKHKENLKKAWTNELKKQKSISQKGKKHWFWKGDKVSYRCLHSWVERELGKAKKCIFCGLSEIPKNMKRYFQWANKSGFYKRDLNDWIELCIFCHKEFDKQKMYANY